MKRKLREFDHQAIVAVAAGYLCLADRSMILELLSFLAGRPIGAADLGVYVEQAGEFLRREYPPFNGEKFLALKSQLDKDSLSSTRTPARWEGLCKEFVSRAMHLRLNGAEIATGACPPVNLGSDSVSKDESEEWLSACACRRLINPELLPYRPAVNAHRNGCNATRTLRDMGAVSA